MPNNNPALRLHPQLDILTVTSELFGENCYILHLNSPADSAETAETACLVVDPGLDPEAILETLDHRGLVPRAILCTHGHADHIAGNAAMKARWPDCPLIIGEGDAPKLGDPVANLSAGFGVGLTSPPADQTVAEGDELDLAGICLTVAETPGHSSGHVVFVARDLQPMVIVGGDVLFAGSIGRSDFPDSDPEALVQSIRAKMYCLPDDALVLTGHGPITTIGQEKRTNPFVRG
ncbi:MBL fold metallo-hydrolase [Pirellulales bacterium]|nr:MBL fold metallo-hydrolase [Pirellulales bacterium]